MSKALKKLKVIISKSDLSPEDQNDLLIFLPILPEPVLKELNKVFENRPKLVHEFNENFKAKVGALSSERDTSAWDDIIEQETEMLRQADKKDKDFDF